MPPAREALDEGENLLHGVPDLVQVRAKHEIGPERVLVTEHDVRRRRRHRTSSLPAGGEAPVDGPLALETDLDGTEELDFREARDERARHLTPYAPGSGGVGLGLVSEVRM